MKEVIEHRNNDNALYSQRGIGIATFIGSPLASSILIKHNYDQLGEGRKGKIVLLLGISFTIFLFGWILFVPEDTIDKLPRNIIPIIYTALIYSLVHLFQGEHLKKFEEEGREYISNWRAAGIGTICMVIIFGVILVFTFLDPVANSYDEGMEEFVKNEEIASLVYEQFDTKSSFELITEINSNSIPKWEQNLTLLDSLEANTDLTEDMIAKNIKLRNYSELKLKELDMLKLSILGNTMGYKFKLDSLNREMGKIIEELN